MTNQQIIDRATNIQTQTDLREFDDFCIEAIKSIAQNNTTNANWQNYTEVTVNATLLETIGTAPRTILPALNTGEFYTYYGILYFNLGTNNPLDLVDNLFIGELTNYSGTLFAGLQASLFNTANEFSSLTKQNGSVLYNATTDVVTYGQPLTGQAIKLTSWGGNDATPNDFNGYVTIKIWYNINTI